MVTCKDINERISAWIDNQLNTQEREELSLHIDGCPFCKEKIALEQYTRKLVKVKLPTVNTPAGLRNKIISQIEEESAPQTLWQRIKSILSTPITRPVPITTALASLVVAYFAYMTWVYQPPVTDIAQWWVCKSASQSYAMDKQGKYSMSYTDPDPKTLIHKVNSAHQRNFSMAIPNLNNQSFSITGCRFGDLAGKPSIYLSLKHDGHLVSLEMINATDIKFPKAVAKSVNGQTYYLGTYYKNNVIIWKNNNLIYTATSDLPENELKKIITPEMISMPENLSCHRG